MVLLCFAVCSLFYVKCIYVFVCFCYVSQLALYFMFYVLFYLNFLLCLAVCSVFYVFLVCFMLCFCFVLQFALYFMLLISLYVLFPVCFTVCFLFDVLCFVLCLPSVLFLLKIWIMLCVCSMFLLCFRFFFFSVMFLIKIGLCLVFLCFCYVCYVDLFSLCFLLCFHSVLQSFFCSICIMLNSDLFSSVFLLGFCSYVSTKFALPFGNPSNLPSQLASELGSLQLVSQVCRGKTSWTNTGQFRPVGSFDHLSRDVFKFSAQQDCIGRRTASRHQAPPSMTPVWKPLDSKETVSTKWANLGDRSKRCFGPKLKMCSRSVKVCGIKVGNIITHMKSYDVSCFSLFMMFFDVIWFA